MRFVVGTIFNLVLPVGAPPADSEQGSLAPAISRNTIDPNYLAHEVMPKMAAPVMSSGSSGNYPFNSPVPSVPAAQQAPQAQLLTPWQQAQQTVSTAPTADKTGHDAALRKATENNIAKGMAPIDAALQGQKDVAEFYRRLTSATEAQRQQFYAAGAELAARDKAKAETAISAKVKEIAKNLEKTGLSPQSAQAKAESDAAAFFQKLKAATPEQLAQFKAFSEAAAKAEANAKAAQAAASKLAADNTKNAVRDIVRRRVASPIKMKRGLFQH